jgi:hypothetical protein
MYDFLIRLGTKRRVMNKYQRAVLIGAGLVIAAIQLHGISEYGLSDSRGWSLSFLISAALLFVGFGSWPVLGSSGKKTAPESISSTAPVATKAEVASKAPGPRPPGKYEYGVHISELDIAIEAHKGYAEKTDLYGPLDGNARSLNWNCCASVYASMRYAARKTQMRIHGSVWNTIVRSVVVRMTVDEIEGVGLGDTKYDELEMDAYSDINSIDKAVEDAISGKGSYPIEPIVDLLSIRFGSSRENIKALAAVILMNVDTARQKILPEMLADLS